MNHIYTSIYMILVWSIMRIIVDIRENVFVYIYV